MSIRYDNNRQQKNKEQQTKILSLDKRTHSYNSTSAKNKTYSAKNKTYFRLLAAK
jgi:hypothetical protein